MENYYDPHGSLAEEYSQPVLCLGPVGSPERTFVTGTNSKSNARVERWVTTAVSAYQMPSPCMTTTTSTSGEWGIFDNESISDERVSQTLPSVT
jgi:hypothetical protein